jgi:hypothetical protein
MKKKINKESVSTDTRQVLMGGEKRPKPLPQDDQHRLKIYE